MTDLLEAQVALEILEKEPLSVTEQIRGLEVILCESGDKEPTIHRDYVYEKLRRIRNGTMNFHPLIKTLLIRERLETKQEVSDE